MIDGLKPYPAYKDSGVPWLGQVPEHWEVHRGKSIFRCIDIRSVSGDEELLTVSSERGVVPRRSATVTMFRAESYAGYKLCWPGDLVINSLWAWAGGLGVSRYHGIVSSAYGVYRLRPGFESCSRFIHELVRSAPFNWELQVRSKGIWISRLQLTDEAFLGSPFPLPSESDLVPMVRFLDYVDRRIRRYISAQRKLIALLNEQKQAIIHRAVTRGLDPDIRLKPSGVEWLGEVPEHWEVRKLRHCGTIEGGMTPSMEVREYWDGDIPWITPKDMKRFAINDSAIRVTTSAIQKTSLRRIRAGSVLLVVRGMILARRVPIAWNTTEVTINQDMKALSPKPEICAPFLAHELNSAQAAFFPLIDEAGHGTRRLPTERWRELPVALPPFEEQCSIINFVEKETEAVDMAVGQASREIDLLHEFRTRLIADMVTGKLDVREAAARLPEEVEGTDLDEVEAVEEEGEEGEDADLDGLSEEVMA